MNWQDHRKLAAALRDQGLADLISARTIIRGTTGELLMVADRSVGMAHVIVAKCQQSVEKTTKGYLLWNDSSFSPERGHTPFTDSLGAPIRAEINRLCFALNKINRHSVNQIKWLESMAPTLPVIAEELKGTQLPLQLLITPKSEYPYWSEARNDLVVPAEGLTMQNHATPALFAARTFFRAMASSEPKDFTGAIRSFLEEHRTLLS